MATQDFNLCEQRNTLVSQSVSQGFICKIINKNAEFGL